MGHRPAGHTLSTKLMMEVLELLDRGVSKRAIARRLGVSEMTVYRYFWARRDRQTEVTQAGTGIDAEPTPGAASRKRRRPTEANPRRDDDGYPDALLRRVPRDYLAMLPLGHYLALVRAAKRATSAAAERSLRQALLLHGEPLIPPPTSIELALSEAEEREWKALAR